MSPIPFPGNPATTTTGLGLAPGEPRVYCVACQPIVAKESDGRCLRCGCDVDYVRPTVSELRLPNPDGSTHIVFPPDWFWTRCVPWAETAMPPRLQVPRDFCPTAFNGKHDRNYGADGWPCRICGHTGAPVR